MLGGCKGKGVEFREEEALEDLGRGTEEGDGTISRP